MIRQFSAQLDVELEERGEETVSLPVDAFEFAEPTETNKSFQAQAQYSQQQAALNYANTQQQAAVAPAPQQESSSSGTMMLVLAAGLCFSLVLLAYYRGKAGKSTEQAATASPPDAYASKVAHIDQHWGDENQAGEWGEDQQSDDPYGMNQ